MAQSHHGVVEEYGQGLFHRRFVQGQGQRVAHGREHVEGRVADFDAARRLRLGHDIALYAQHRLRRESAQRLQRLGRVEHDLHRPAHVAQHQEVDASQPAQRVQPTGHLHPFPDVCLYLACVDSLRHMIPSSGKIKAPAIVQGRGGRSRCHLGLPGPHGPDLNGLL